MSVLNTPTRTLWMLRLLALLLAGAFAALAHWQWSRAEWKQHWLDDYAQAISSPAVPLQVGLEKVGASDPVPVRISLADVTYQGSRFLLDNQQRDGRAGVLDWIVISHANRYWLLELGWLPFSSARELPDLPILPAALHGDALLLPWPSQGIRLGRNGALALNGRAGAPLAYLDRLELEAALGVALQPGILRLLPGGELGHRIDELALPNTLPPEKHRGYAVQWAALSLGTVLVLGVLTWKRRSG
ncbi:MAG: SURF1 family protein [Alphaproteobacteria bacterium ADurb.BinA280]|jgi:surfeit locus 1 family protein|nr:SURF1 family protein [Xanthomonadales bacterium]OPZ12852.1 MAG: SURF1 family protein [Alphaproteobacteria bacterium ADurb.BinA280]